MPVLSLMGLISALISAHPRTHAQVASVTGVAMPFEGSNPADGFDFFKSPDLTLTDGRFSQFMVREARDPRGGAYLYTGVQGRCITRIEIEQAYGRLGTLGDWAKARGATDIPPTTFRTLQLVASWGYADFEFDENFRCVIDFSMSVRSQAAGA